MRELYTAFKDATCRKLTPFINKCKSMVHDNRNIPAGGGVAEIEQ